MKNKKVLLGSITIAMALGTAWAIRGKFGHEQGAAWAGAIGALAVVLVAKRSDWYNHVFKIALAAAFGWGLGGMISYGVVVGYGRGDDFVNVYYGLLMLFVIGAQYGFLGGGLFGLSLSDSDEFKVRWATLVVEMLAFALLTYAFLINQLEWLMTPPRSELWAACLGASIAAAWYMIRNKQMAALRVAIYAALGAGFGFAFGNFLQVLGRGSSLPFNFWNVMEYSIGFFGGLGMGYGTLTAQWPVAGSPPRRTSNLVPMLIVSGLIPFIVWEQSFTSGKLKFLFDQGGNEQTVILFQALALSAVVVIGAITIIKYYRLSHSYETVRSIFLISLGLYCFLSFLLTGIFVHPIEQYLYLGNIGIILILLPRIEGSLQPRDHRSKYWIVALIVIVVVLAALALIAMHSHGPLKGSQIRFK